MSIFVSKNIFIHFLVIHVIILKNTNVIDNQTITYVKITLYLSKICFPIHNMICHCQNKNIVPLEI
jgi:uncharacterized membrane protein YGL010W